ncbi:MFS transporter [Sphingobium lactosutens]|uniref:Major facilitator superfamily (MFS) profile domain-containing protein n=1 Tax=Sphingobium lactosutens DS20 TaxID=1331060 RepID=T0J261_9SPHN|nr:MFS transporter [Sphingobium lactosutens]EQB12456.1 hypothetical protein RLDS_20190 [Sphingobium lactosutens DS20]EQB18215.1 hypothetical protein RLDS_02930 [Sphingobium lactosutens DS20]
MILSGADPVGGDDRATNIGALIDRAPWSPYQKLLLCLVSLAILLDGFDNQALGFALPHILRDWKLAKADLSMALAAAQLGMFFGAIGGGLIGDRLGRKSALVGSVLLFGVATALIGLADGPGTLAALRLCAGIGLGAAFPNVAALAAEFTPARRRSLAVVITIVCVPLGGVIGGTAASFIMPLLGWRSLFVGAGAVTLAICGLIVIALPESVRFLARSPKNADRVAAILRRMGIDPSDGLPLLMSEGCTVSEKRHSEGSIFASSLRLDTLLLWTAFFFSLMSVYAAFNWLPTLLADDGHDIVVASRGLVAFNLGGVVAALCGGWAISRFGSRVTMVTMAFAAILSAVALAFMPTATLSLPMLFTLLALEGGFINGVQTTLYALGSAIYPTSLRASGVGAATGIGRVGAIASSLLGAMVIGWGAAAGFHWSIAIVMFVVALALLGIRNHARPAVVTRAY